MSMATSRTRADLNRCLGLWTVVLLLGLSLPAIADEPTLARLSFWVPPEKMAGFEAAYQEQLVPLLKQHGLAESPQRGRATVDSVFSRLFEVAKPSASKDIDAVLNDSVFGATLDELGTRFGNPPAPIRHELALYSVPSGPGRSTLVGPGHAVLTGRDKKHWISYDETDGLVGGLVRAITQDRNGNMWFGHARGGVCRFDGVRFETFSSKDGLPKGEVTAVFQDRGGDIWFGTGAGLARYDGVNFVIYTQQDGLPTNVIRVISQDHQGALWLGTDKGLSRYDGQHFKTFTNQDGLAGNNVSCILQDRQGVLWVGTDGGLCRYDGQQFTSFTVKEGLLSNHVFSILQDHQENLWIGTDKGVSRYDGRAFTNYTTALLGSGVSSIAQDSTGALWFATYKGLGCLVGDHLDFLSVADGLSNEWITRLFVDREGNLWVGTFSNVDCLPYEEGLILTRENGLPESTVWSIAQDREGDMWFGTYSGVCRYDGRQVTTYTQDDGLPGNDIFRILKARNGDLWFGVGGSGICRYDGQRFTSFTPEDGLPSPPIWSLGEDRDGNIWVGTGRGVSRWDGTRFTTFTTVDGLASDWVNAILQDRRGDLWFGTGNGGLSRWDGEHFTNFAAIDGLPGEDVRALFEDDKGQLWVGTAGDFVARWDGERFTTFANADGITGSWGWAIAQDHGGVVWIGSWSGGVSLWDGHLFQSLTQKDGLASNQVRSLYEDRAGNMWVGTTGGVSRIRKTALSPPLVSIDAVVADRRYVNEREVRVSSNVGRIAFEFHGTSFKTRPNGLVYRYRLRDYDRDWQTTRTRRVEYEHLPRGTYTFEVQAVDRDLNYSETPATVAIEVFHQAIVSPVRLAEVHLQDLFASFYKTYNTQPLGTVQVINDSPDSVSATLSFFLPDYMRRPSEQPVSLAPNSTQQVEVKALLDEQVLSQRATVPVQAEVSLAVASGDQSFAAQKKQEIILHGRGALTWAPVGKAAAFITPDDPAVSEFTRSTLVAFEEQVRGLGKPCRNLLRAMVLFEALKAHGVRYIPDANTPYTKVSADRSVVDHISYPAEVLQQKAGDCDDLTVLFCALLENAGVSTALVDAPGHIFLLFDTGVSRQEAYKLPVEEKLYVVRGDRVWVPVEVTKIADGFAAAWQAGAEEVAALGARELREKVVDTAEAWEQYAGVSPAFEGKVVAPGKEVLEEVVGQQHAAVAGLIDAHLARRYLDPLKVNPGDGALWLELAKVYMGLQRYEAAIQSAYDRLIERGGQDAGLLNQLGIAYFLKGDVRQAAYSFQQAVGLAPDDKKMRGNLDKALGALGKGEGLKGKPPAEVAGSEELGAEAVGGAKAGQVEMDEDSFYWGE